MAEIAKPDGTKKYYYADNGTEEKYAEMHLPYEDLGGLQRNISLLITA